MYKFRSFTFRTSFVIQCKKLHDYMQRRPWLISSLMHNILIYLHIIHLLKSSTCFEHYPAHLQEVYVVIALYNYIILLYYTTVLYNYDVDLLKMSRVMLETCKGF